MSNNCYRIAPKAHPENHPTLFLLGAEKMQTRQISQVWFIDVSALWTQFQETAEKAIIQAFEDLADLTNSAKLKMLQIPYLVTQQGIAVKGLDILLSREEIMTCFEKGVKHLTVTEMSSDRKI